MQLNTIEYHEDAILPLKKRDRGIFGSISWLFHKPLVGLTAGCLVIFIISAITIMPNLGYPRQIIFDETYFIPAAQRYLTGTFFLEPHPPLGKLLIAAGQKWYNSAATVNQFIDREQIKQSWPQELDITGYRLAPAFFGMLNPLLVFFILAFIIQRKLYAFVLSVAVALDNALIVESRASLMDSILIFFCLASILVFVALSKRKSTSLRGFIGLSALWGVMLAAAANVKLTGLFLLVLVAFYALGEIVARRYRRLIILGITVGLAFSITYLGLWGIHFYLGQHLGKNTYDISKTHQAILKGEYQPDIFTRFSIQFKDALKYQANYEKGVPRYDPAKKDEIGSPWYLWPVGGRAFSYRWETPDGKNYQYIYLLGNPLVWLISLLGVVGGISLVIADILCRILPAGQRKWLYIFVALYAAYMVPMMFIQRVMYLYHYLPALLLGVILFGLVLERASSLSLNTKRDILIAVFILVIAVFWFYKPLTYYEPLTAAQFQQRNIWPAWNLRCINCQK
jgi:dolichyl-phosphate-mannose-protein mannosyltransferase